MRRQITFPVPKAWIKNPKNSSPNASKGARAGTAAATKLCVFTLFEIFKAHFTQPTAYYDSPVGEGDTHSRTQANRWTVTLTRISMGTVDPITGGATMAAVQDAVATWCGVKDERDPIWHWNEPIRQEKRARGWFGVRVEIEDLAAGHDKIASLESIDRFIALAKLRIKEAKRTKAADAVAGELRACGVPFKRRGDVLAPKATDLRDAMHDVMRRGATMRARPDDDAVRRNGVLSKPDTSKRAAAEKAFAKVTKPKVADMRITAEERAALPADLTAMRALARSVACPTCPEPMPSPAGKGCFLVDGEPYEYGVHVARARLAGLPPYPSVAELNAGMRPYLDGGICLDCDGCGWNEGGETLRTDCKVCKGTGMATGWVWLPKSDYRVKGKRARATYRERSKGPGLSSNDPGEEKSPRALKPCPRASCFAALDVPCVDDGGAMAFGVHVERAEAAGVRLTGHARQLIDPPRAKVSTNGRRVVTAAHERPAWVALPWLACGRCIDGARIVDEGDDGEPIRRTCEACGGVAVLKRDKRLDGGSRERVRYEVPEPHRARFGNVVTLRKRESVRDGERIWLYE